MTAPDVNTAAREKAAELGTLLQPLRDAPARSAIFCDIDGTIAPIAPRADEAIVPDAARQALTALSRRYAAVGCLSGRRVTDARHMVGIGSLTYIGNHGFERLLPGARGPELDPLLAGHESDAAEFARGWDTPALRSLRLRIEDKAAIWAFHWRGAPDEEEAEAKAREIAAAAEEQGLVTHWGRKVLEVRPPVSLDKGTALAELLEERGIARALYGGDDLTDIDAFRRLREMRDRGNLETAICVGVASDESLPELAEEADVVVTGTPGFLTVLKALAG